MPSACCARTSSARTIFTVVWMITEERKANRVAGGLTSRPTPPAMRVRVRRFLAVLADQSVLFLCHAGSRPDSAVRLQRQPCVQLWSYCLPSSALPERQCQPCPVLSRLLACAAVAARRLDPLVAAFVLSYERETLRNGWFRAATVDHLLGMKFAIPG